MAILKTDRFYKEVEHIQSLYKSEIAGNLSDYFTIVESDDYWLKWLKEPPVRVKNAVLDAAYKFIAK